MTTGRINQVNNDSNSIVKTLLHILPFQRYLRLRSLSCAQLRIVRISTAPELELEHCKRANTHLSYIQCCQTDRIAPPKWPIRTPNNSIFILSLSIDSKASEFNTLTPFIYIFSLDTHLYKWDIYIGVTVSFPQLVENNKHVYASFSSFLFLPL